MNTAAPSAGLPAAEFRVAAAGETGSATADGSTTPLRRRADVVLRMSRN